MILQFLANGIVVGSVYSLVALGFGLIYSSTHIFHIAHGAVYTLAAYVFYSSARTFGLNMGLSIVLALGSAGVLGLCMEHFVYYPLFKRKASPGIFLISSLGIYIFVVNLIAMLYGNETKILSPGVEKTFKFGSVILTRIQILELLAFLTIFPIFLFVMRRTKLGKIIRALASNLELATVLGIDVKKIRLYIFAIGSILAGIASCLVALDVGMDPNVGMNVLLISAVAVIMGGVGVFEGPVLGAFALGLVQNMLIWKISARWEAMVTFLLLICFLLFRPHGILGKRRRLEEA